MDIIKKLEKLDISAISDALDQYGVNGGCHLVPRSKNKKIIGRAFTVKFKKVDPGIFAKAADYIEEVKEGEVIVIDNNGDNSCTVWGNILTKTAIIKKISGTIIYGACRDSYKISNCKYPIFSKDVFMKTGKNRVILDYVQKPVYIDGILVNHGDYIKGDESGVIIIPSGIIEQIIIKAEQITINEEAILRAVKKGMSLNKAREKYNYNLLPFKDSKKHGNN
ncbi:MAG: RraA family protein [Candidatus Staskawiczbacteria bacterium]|nr:RraA family protein [Candidatus Staskawiczbacteria bacterium]